MSRFFSSGCCQCQVRSFHLVSDVFELDTSGLGRYAWARVYWTFTIRNLVSKTQTQTFSSADGSAVQAALAGSPAGEPETVCVQSSSHGPLVSAVLPFCLRPSVVGLNVCVSGKRPCHDLLVSIEFTVASFFFIIISIILFYFIMFMGILPLCNSIHNLYVWSPLGQKREGHILWN